MTTFTNIADQTASSKLGTYVHAPSVQRLTPEKRSNGDSVGRCWQKVDVGSKERGSIFKAFGNVSQARAMFERIPQGVGRPPVQECLMLGLIVACASVSMSYRKLEGFAASFAEFLQVPTHLAPDHSTINKFMSKADYARVQSMLSAILVFDKPKAVYVAIDATGLATGKSGGWFSDKPGGDIRRGKYKKWHVVTDIETGFIVAWELTESDGEGSADAAVGPDLLVKAAQKTKSEIKAVAADGAYTGDPCFQAARKIGAALLVPLPPNAVYSSKNKPKGTKPTDRDILLTQQSRLGRKEWKVESGYHQRSQAENTFSVTEKIWGNKLQHKTGHNQHLELIIKVHLFNKAVMSGQAALKQWLEHYEGRLKG